MFITLFRFITEYMGLTMFYRIFFSIPHIQPECGECLRIFLKILSIPQNIVVDLNNAMFLDIGLQIHQNLDMLQFDQDLGYSTLGNLSNTRHFVGACYVIDRGDGAQPSTPIQVSQGYQRWHSRQISRQYQVELCQVHYR